MSVSVPSSFEIFQTFGFVSLCRYASLLKGRTIRKVMGGGGFSKRQYIFFCTPIEEIFFSHLMAGNIFFKLKFIGLSFLIFFWE